MEDGESSLLEILQSDVALPEKDFVAKHPEPVLVTPFHTASSDSLRIAEVADPVASYADNMYAAYGKIRVYRVGAFGTHTFKGTLYVLGSAESCDVRLEGDGVSAAHAILRMSNDDWLLKSSLGNRTYVANACGFERPLEESEEFALSDASKIRCGGVELEFYTPAGFLRHLKNLDAMARSPNAS